jgi:nucleoside phosphorylase
VLGLSYRECRSWVDRLPDTREAKRAQGVIRPRGLGLYRSRPPLPVLLYLADREGRLVGRSADGFAVIEPPIARFTDWKRAMRQRPRKVRALGWLVRAWQYVLPFAPAVIAMLIAIALVLAFREGALVAAVLVLAGVALAAIDLIVGVIRLTWSLLRSGNVSDREIFGDELRGVHWTITFCHTLDLGDADRLCTDAYRRASALTDACLPEDPAFGSGYVGVRAASFTGSHVKDSLGFVPSLEPVPRTDWFVIGAKRHFTKPDHDAVRPLSGIRLMLVATFLGLAVSAQVVASLERETYPAALAWVLKHVLFQFPESATMQSQVIGALVTVMVPVMAAGVVLTLRWHIRYRQARRNLMYNAIERMAAAPTVAIVVVNQTECKAVEDAFVARSPGLAPEPGRAGAKAVTLIGTLGGANIVLAQSEQGTVGAGSMPWTVDNLIKQLDPAFLVLSGICYGLRSRELDGGDQEIGDVVVATQLRAVEHRKMTTRADGSDYEITRGPRPEAASDLLSHARVLGRAREPKVHFGPVLSLNTLVNSANERARLRALDEEAVAGEMEAVGLYAAAAQAKCDWIIVKGISDWGIEKTDEHQSRAARHAADFVADLIAQIEPGAGVTAAGSPP